MSSVLYTNAKVWQPDGVFTEAFGVSNGHFNFSGSNLEAAALEQNYSEKIDLGGKLVLPAFTDGHLHLVYGAKMRKLLDCSEVKTIATLKEAVNNYYNSNRDLKWIIGSNLDLNSVFPDPQENNGNIPDAIFDEVPLYISNYDYHSAIINSKAVEASGLLKHVDTFSKSEIALTPDGRPNGIIREKAMNFVISAFPEQSIKEKVKDVTDCIKMLHSYGITTVSDITLPEDIDVYLELSRQKKLNIRVNSYLPFTEFENLKLYEEKTKDLDPDYFTIKGFKAFWDGALGSETALYSLNYKGKSHNGFKTKQAETGEIKRIAEKIDAAGKQMIIHAIGDKAVTEVLDLYESLSNTRKLRHRIEHAQHIQPAEYERFGRIGAIASVQPVHLKYDAKTVFEKLPAKLINNTHNYVHIMKYGGVLNFGTDFPIVSAEPFENIRLAATRVTNYGEFTFEHRIPMHECIKAYTYNNAYSNHNENAAGSISQGMAADFIVLKDDLFLSNDENFIETGVLETYLCGEKVFG